MLCIAAMKTLTAAIKGKRALLSEKIECEVISLDGNLTKNGCAYGLSFLAVEREKAQKVLQRNKIPYGEILG